MKHLFHSKENITNYNSLSNHLVEISKYLTTNINKMKNCQNSFKFPFVASEILSNTHDKIEKKLFLIKEDEKPLILKIIETLLKFFFKFFPVLDKSLYFISSNSLYILNSSSLDILLFIKFLTLFQIIF